MGLLFEQSRLERVRTWAMANKQRFRPNGFGRQFALLQEFPDVPDAIWDIKRDVVAHFGLHDLPQEPLYRDLCGVITEEARCIRIAIPIRECSCTRASMSWSAGPTGEAFR